VGWLNALTCGSIRARSGILSPGQPREIEKWLKNIEIKRLYNYLDEICRVTAWLDTSMNTQLALESLLIPWSHRLENS
jgi:hypothetical protein